MKAIINVRLYDYVTYIESGYVLFDEKIIEVGSMQTAENLNTQLERAEMVIDGGGKWLLPGLINFHTHVYSAFARGLDFGSKPETFTSVLEEVWWKLDKNLTIDDVYWSAVAYAQESLKKGVIGLIDHNASGEIQGSTAVIEKAFSEVGLHGITCFETSDRFNIDQAIAENMEMISRTNGPFGMHASMTLSHETLVKIKKTIDTHPIHIHVSESENDQFAYPESPVQRLDTLGLINENSLLVHGVHMSPEDAQIIKKRNAVLAVCMRSNLNNAVGTVDYDMLHAYHLPVVAGTDGLGVNIAASWQDLYYQSKMNSGNPSGVSLDWIIKAIVESYKYYERLTGLKLGRFSPDYRFDAMLLNYDAFTPVDETNAFGHVFYGLFDALDITDVWVGGKQLMHDKKMLNKAVVDPEVAERLWKRIGGGLDAFY